MQLRILLFWATIGVICLCTPAAQAVPYLNSSAHGDATLGVKRTSTAAFAVANCAHCHEQHASVDGAEPAPATGPKGYLLFDKYTPQTQTTNFCFDCHVNSGSQQAAGFIYNRSYSYRAGGWSLDPINDIKGAFAPAQGSTHNLADIVTLSTAKWPAKYSDKSNACAVCHDPHVVKGDPLGFPNNFKSSGTRGQAITEVNSSPANLWGDDAAEKINSSTAIPPRYQAPYRTGAGIFEPDGDSTQDGSNLPDYVVFCSKCHDSGTTIYSNDLGRNLKVINWTASGDKHGQAAADVDIRMNAPYLTGVPNQLHVPDYVLSCLDCHEPHGSGNLSLLRGKVNGGVLNGIIKTSAPQNYDLLCGQCHNSAGGVSAWDDVHHLTDQAYARVASCDAIGCHPDPAGALRINCVNCHFHGSVSGVDPVTPVPKPLNIDTTAGPLGRKNF
jgi:predicted CXXCH cytochrome family protein